MYEGGRNALDKFRGGCVELLGYGVAHICDLVANRSQDFFASFGQAQSCDTIRLERSVVSTSHAANAHNSHLDHSDCVTDI
jgi:hypothetical protein